MRHQNIFTIILSLNIWLFLPKIVYGQKVIYITIRGENEQKLKIIDSLSYKQEYFFSEYYVDSISNVPYTGIAVKKNGLNAIKNITVINGYINGWVKEYILKDSVKQLHSLLYYNQEEKIFIANPVTNFLKRKTSYFSFNMDNMRYRFTIKTSQNSIKLFQTVYKADGKYEIKKVFKHISELETYIKKYEIIYSYCKEAGFFGKPEIE